MQISLFDGNKPFKIDKPVRLIELFAGIGSQAKALKNLNVDFEHYRICEFDKYAVQSYNAVHGTNFTTSDITKIKAGDLDITDTDKYCYIMTYSFPCFTADSLVLTKKGYKNIVDIQVGDYVLTHDNSYKKVVNTFNNGKHQIYSIKGMGIDEIKTTFNHKFYVREMYRKGHNKIRCFKEPRWKEVKDLSKKDYLGVAINQEDRVFCYQSLPTQDNNFWWLIGRYIGDGWIRTQGGIIICCGKNERYELIDKLNELNFNYNIIEEETVVKFHIPKKKLSEFCEQFGKGASNKHLTQDIISLPTWYLESFVEGYLSADGCFTNGVYKATTTSRELAYGIAQCIAKVYKTPYRIYKVKAKPTKVIESRIVNQKDWYQVVFKKSKCKQDKAFYENGYIWYPIKEITAIGKENVYDIEVEDNHSFTVQNTIVHNCQDLSNAGKQAGMAKGSGTRSGLLWEVERLLDECEELPQVLLMENVPAVIGSANIEHFAKWQEKLESLGYKNKWQILNAKDYGIPQNRERCFMASILGDYYYEFPEKIPLKLRLKDMLESNVEEKYYLTDSTIERISKWNAQQDPLKDIDKEKLISPCLTARGAGEEHSGMVLISEPKHEEPNLKRELCNNLVKNGLVEEDDIIRHSYTKSRMQGDMKDIKEKGLCPTLDTRCDCLGITVKEETDKCNRIGTLQGGNLEPKVICGIGEKKSNNGTQWYRQDRVYDNNIATAVTADFNPYYIEPQYSDYSLRKISDNIVKGDTVGAITANAMQIFNHDNCHLVANNYRIRKLTPKECWRLMGFSDSDVDKAIAIGMSNAQLYKQAGNSIVVNVLMAIFEKMI